jgi:endonuclease/exonuclease/phosphatase family metal-dependent hydrolase
MNYNVENLWDADPYNSDPAIMSFYEPFQKDKSNWYDPRIQTKVIQNFINVLQAAGLPDIITLQEIEAAANQSKVLAASAPLTKKLKELGYQTFIVGPQEENHPVAITTAVISRYPLQAYPSLKLNASTYQQFAPHLKGRHGRHARDIQIVGLSLAGTQTFFLVQHWAAAWQNARPRTPSIAQIHQANSMALKEGLACKKNKNLNPVSAFPWCRAAARPHPAAKIILVGDFNTHLGSPALPPAPWINLWMTLPPTQRWESVWQGRPGTLAHIILAPSFTQAAGLQYLPGSFKVQRDFLLNVDGTPLRRQYLKEKPRGKIFYRFSGEGYSDHLPLLATFNIFPPGLPILPLKMKQQKYTSAALGTSPQRPPANCPPLTEKDLERPARGGCFTVDLRAHPRPLKTAGIYRHNYIEWGTHKLYLVMEDIWAGSASLGPKGEKEWPKKALENFCINRQILQKRGSHLVYARGKLGFFKDGWALYLSTRQDFRLTHLSRRKALACR